ncbi:MAG: DedA family protein [Aphanocapsa lilacina HA4352-LM1]|jgi:membrane protein DedA with SNARE-associated domain|nr:DedA family protein [Aphanocapsa lilacina HA4352-LM1]
MIEQLAESIQHFLESNGPLGYLLIAGIIFLENSGLPLPGETTLILASVLASKEILAFPLVLIAAICGAILGDNMGYFIGRRFGRDLVLKYGKVFGLTQDKFDRAEAAFLKNSAWAVFIGRFIVLLRILAGPLAGITRMPWPKFVLFNALGAFAWGGAIGTAAYFFGVAVLKFFEGIGVWGLILLVVAIIAFGVVRHFMDERAEHKAAKKAKIEPEQTTTTR